VVLSRPITPFLAAATGAWLHHSGGDGYAV